MSTVRRRQWFSPAARSLMAATGAADPRVAITQLADDLLEEADIREPYVDLVRVASHQSVRTVEAVPMSGAGRLVPQGSGFLIQVNESHVPGKQHFTTGHEIGHTLIPSFQARPRPIEDSATGLFQQDQEEEYLCDIAAAELLMPMALFMPLAAAQGFNLRTLDDLRRRFRASREATARRLVQTELWPCAVAVWHQAHKPADIARMDCPTLPGFGPAAPPKKLRLRYAACSSSFGYFLHRHLAAEADGCLARCFVEGGVVYSNERLVLRERYVEFYVMAAAVSFDGDTGPTREVISLLLPANAPATALAVQPDLWSSIED